MNLISIIIPTRAIGNTQNYEIYLNEAIQSIKNQAGKFNIEIIVKKNTNKQFEAMNEAVSDAHGEIIAFLEDDDIWHDNKLSIQLPFLDNYDFISCAQQCFGESDHIDYYPTPSGWLIKKNTWEHIGGFDGSFMYHGDSDFLGKIKHLKRLHIVPANADFKHYWFNKINTISHIHVNNDALVFKRIRSDSNLGTIAQVSKAWLLSNKENEIIKNRYKIDRIAEIPW